MILATTFSGLSTQHALARATQAATRSSARVDRLPAAIDPVEAVFAFGDDLDAVNYQISFEPGARDQARVGAACQVVLTDQPTFEAALRVNDKVQDIAHDLLAAAEPTVELCFDSLSADEEAEARAAEGFADFHEHAFDFAAALR